MPETIISSVIDKTLEPVPSTLIVYKPPLKVKYDLIDDNTFLTLSIILVLLPKAVWHSNKASLLAPVYGVTEVLQTPAAVVNAEVSISLADKPLP